MSDMGISRRSMLGASVAIGGSMAASMLSPAVAATPGGVSALQLEDPKARARLLAKLKGSIAEETVYTFTRLHLYLWLNDGNLKPMLTMQNLAAGSWTPLPNGNYKCLVREVGTYTAFDTDEVVDHWVNPVTGEKREIWQFAGGPLSVEIGPDGIVTGPEATLKPKDMRIDVIAGKVLAPNQSSFSFPNPFKEDKWPKEAGGPTFYWDSHYFFAADLRDIQDPSKSSALSTVQFQNLVSFHPWLGMGKTPGRTWGKGLGTKLRSLDDLPRGARLALEKKTPEIFDLKSWTKPRIDFAEYMTKYGPGEKIMGR
ncbi:MAG: hypothetical protein RL580_743 [Pseudomonadota bacterium]|jgi:hypothetical protein